MADQSDFNTCDDYYDNLWEVEVAMSTSLSADIGDPYGSSGYDDIHGDYTVIDYDDSSSN